MEVWPVKRFFLICLLSIAGLMFSCSRFSIYSNMTMMGMNFDYFGDPEIKIEIISLGDVKALILSFQQGSNYYSALGMNDAGVFITLQSVVRKAYTGNIVTTKNLGVLFYEILGWKDLDGLDDYLRNYRIVSPRDFSLHTHVAHADGKAFVLETGAEGNVVIGRTGQYMVLTNFFLGDYSLSDGGTAVETGCWRYEKICQGLDDFLGSIDLGKGLAVLKAGSQSLTLASMIFVPEEGAAYLWLERDFDRCWRISLEAETIETLSGFEKTRISRIGEEGILASSLDDWR